MKEAGHKKPGVVCFHWCEMSRIGTLETKYLAEAGGWESWGITANGNCSFLELMKMF